MFVSDLGKAVDCLLIKFAMTPITSWAGGQFRSSFSLFSFPFQGKAAIQSYIGRAGASQQECCEIQEGAMQSPAPEKGLHLQ